MSRGKRLALLTLAALTALGYGLFVLVWPPQLRMDPAMRRWSPGCPEWDVLWHRLVRDTGTDAPSEAVWVASGEELALAEVPATVLEAAARGGQAEPGLRLRRIREESMTTTVVLARDRGWLLYPNAFWTGDRVLVVAVQYTPGGDPLPAVIELDAGFREVRSTVAESAPAANYGLGPFAKPRVVGQLADGSLAIASMGWDPSSRPFTAVKLLRYDVERGA
ncbi:MAG TPA: hypothetical protein VEI97_00555 [bacterium]|nr:hypothetical protein [bacterium]